MCVQNFEMISGVIFKMKDLQATAIRGNISKKSTMNWCFAAGVTS